MGWNHTLLFLWFWLFSLSTASPGITQVACQGPPLLMLSHISLHVRTAFCLSVRLSTEAGLLPPLGCCESCCCEHLSESLLSNPGGFYGENSLTTFPIALGLVPTVL